MIQFFMPMEKVPTATGQEKGYSRRTGTYYEPPKLKQARAELMMKLAPHSPYKPVEGPIHLITWWRFPKGKSHKAGDWKTTKPDTDNLQKVLKDCMTRLNFWNDDAQVCVEYVGKVWSETAGIFVAICNPDEEDLIDELEKIYEVYE